MVNHVQFSNFPSEIIIDILSRLPAKYIIQCRCVCKSWLKIISDTEFVDFHLSQSPTGLIINNISDSTTESACFNLVEVKAENEPNSHDLDHVPGMKLLKSHSGFSSMIGSINGIVCLGEFENQHESFHIWNPIMRECITLQAPYGVRKYLNIIIYGFGFSSLTCQYKLARIFQESKDNNDSARGTKGHTNPVCHIYTLGSGSWRSIGCIPFVQKIREGRSLFLNGNLHWLIHDSDGCGHILCLDVEKEVFQPFPHPDLDKGYLAKLNIYDGCLSFNLGSYPHFEIWVMKEYGVQESWTKEVIVSKDPINFLARVHIIKVFKDGEILFLRKNNFLFSYHPKKDTVEYIDTLQLIETGKKRTISRKVYLPLEVMDHVSSFLSLKRFETEIVHMV